MWYKFVYGVLYGILWLMHHGTVVEGREKIPETGCILCPNHRHLLDPVHVAFSLGHREKPRFMAKAELFKNRIFGAILRSVGAFPVKRGKADIHSIRESLQILNDGGKLLIFPEGTRVKDGEEVDAKAGAAFLASRAGVPMVPMYIENSTKMFSIVKITVGEPILPEGKRPDLQEMSERLMAAIDELRRKAAGEH
ncbi:MAG: 1-acyl-sn-glycerol-3-phosphate acyltransferase [Ruminococcaceae bacterium]|nr:1-acyl-sn-glycerol-3-phosphate acyltransferase [Oscillospiraceae bacterium]